MNVSVVMVFVKGCGECVGGSGIIQGLYWVGIVISKRLIVSVSSSGITKGL